MNITSSNITKRVQGFAFVAALISAALAAPKRPAPVQAALDAVSNAEVASDDSRNVPTFVHGKFGLLAHHGKGITETELKGAVARAAAIRGVSPTDLSMTRVDVDELGFAHARYAMKKNGLPVVGARLDLHIDDKGAVFAASGNVADDATVATVAAVAAPTAVAKARTVVGSVPLKTPTHRLVYVIVSRDQSLHLAHEVELQSESGSVPLHALVYIDATSGDIVDVHSQIYNSDVISVVDFLNTAGTSQAFVGSYTNPNPDQVGNFFTSGDPNRDPAINSTIRYTARTYNFYLNTFSRDSYDAAGATMLSAVNLAAKDQNGNVVGYNNAYYDPQQHAMFFGNGDGVHYSNFALALDVTSHEYTHALTFSTSGLIYANEPGAINEAISDILGISNYIATNNLNVSSSDTWRFGHDICLSSAPHNALRYLDNPTADGQSKDFYADRYQLPVGAYPYGPNDNGFVHLNSGIANLAFKLLVTGGVHPRAGTSVNGTTIPTTTVPAIGLATARRVFYLADTSYLTPGAQFSDLRAATVAAANSIDGSGNTATAVNIAWNVVGVPMSANTHPINISTRAQVGTGDKIMIAGFVLNGGGSAKPMLIRGIGPALGAFGVGGTVSDPQLTLYSNGSQIAYNDDWSSSGNAAAIAQTAQNVGAFALPNPSKDACLLPTLGNGSYSAQVSGGGGQTGIGMVEVYDTDASNPNHLVNISTRAVFSSGTPGIAGFVISGAGNKVVLIRGVGPTLGSFGVSGTLPHPLLQLYSGSTVIAGNQNWQVDLVGNQLIEKTYQIQQVTSKVGGFPLQTHAIPQDTTQLVQTGADAAILISLPAGAYTVQIRDTTDGVAGVGLIEVYEVN